MQHATTSERTTPWQKAVAVIMAVVLALGLTPGFGTAQAIADEGNLAAASIEVQEMTTQEVTVKEIAGEDSTYGSEQTKAGAPFLANRTTAVTYTVYTATEIGQTGKISKIAFKNAEAASMSGALEVYMGLTDANAITSSSMPSPNDMTLVYTSDNCDLGKVAGWETLTLTTAFDYTGDKNLVVAVFHASDSTSTLQTVGGGSNWTNKTLNKWSSTKYDSFSAFYSQLSYVNTDSDLAAFRPSIQLTFGEDQSSGGGDTQGDTWGPSKGSYLISTTADMKAFRDAVNDGSLGSGKTVTVKEGATIDLSSENNWTPIGSNDNHYVGVFDGQGATITGLTISSTENGVGLFGNVDAGSILKNFTVEGSVSSSGRGVGAIVGTARVNDAPQDSEYGVIIDGVVNKATVTSTYATDDGYHGAGGIVGNVLNKGSISISNCANKGAVTSTYSPAGIIGFVAANDNQSVTMSNCYNVGNIVLSTSNAPDAYAAGLANVTKAGYVDSAEFTRCYNAGTVSIAGNPDATRENVVSTVAGKGAVSAVYYLANSCNYGYMNSDGGVGQNVTGSATSVADMATDAFVSALNNGLVNKAFIAGAGINTPAYPALAWEGGSSEEPETFAITVVDAEHGSVSVTGATEGKAAADTEITIVASPEDETYEVDQIVVKKTGDESAVAETVTNNKFTMPNYPVTVTVTFAKKSVAQGTLDFTLASQGGSTSTSLTQGDTGDLTLSVNLSLCAKKDSGGNTVALTAADAESITMSWFVKEPGKSSFASIDNASGHASFYDATNSIKSNESGENNGYNYTVDKASLSVGEYQYKCVVTWAETSYTTCEKEIVFTVTVNKAAPTKVTSIKSPEDMKAFADSVNAGVSYDNTTVEMTQDVDLNSYANWTPIGTSDHPFTGTFDGKNKKITGLSITAKPSGDYNYTGLFGNVDGATIQGFSLEGSVKANDTFVAGVVGYAKGAVTISEVRNLANVTNSKDDYYDATVAGIVAGMDSSTSLTVSKCANKGNIVGSATSYTKPYVGGIVGRADTSNKVSCVSCYNLGNVKSMRTPTGDNVTEPVVGGIMAVEISKSASASNFAISNCYNAGVVTPSGTSTNVAALIAGKGEITAESFWANDLTNSTTIAASNTSGTATPKSSADMKEAAFVTTLGENWQDGSVANENFGKFPALSWEEKSTPVTPATKYKVTFYDEDGTTVLKEATEYEEGTVAASIVKPTDPTKEATAEYTYVFDGWDPAVADVTADATYKAKYKATKNKYNVTFMNGETELSKTAYEYGTEAASITTPADPTKAATAEYTYEFEGWKPAIEKVTADATYTAIYRTISKETAATGVEATGDIFASVNADESMELIVKDTTDQDESTLAAEYAEQIGTNEVAAVYEVDLVKHKTGQADEEITTGVGNLTLTFPLEDVEDGTQVKVLQLHEVTVAGQSELQVQVYSYNGTVQNGAVTITLNGLLSKFIITVASDEEPAVTTYTVTFESNGGSAVAKQTVEAGAKATKPADPTRTGYTFGGWYADKELKTAYDFSKAVSADTTLYAKWTAAEKDDETVETVTLYRLYNPNSGEHLFTTDKNEFDTLPSYGWKQEGTAWKAPKTSSTPVYRLYNPNSGDHHYTMDANEYSELAKIGWKQEGTAWYSDDAKGVGLYRLFNPNATIGTHHYTLDENEYNTLGRIGWEQEGTCWYGVK